MATLITEEQAETKIQAQLGCDLQKAFEVACILVDFFGWKFTKANITKANNLHGYFRARNLTK